MLKSWTKFNEAHDFEFKGSSSIQDNWVEFSDLVHLYNKTAFFKRASENFNQPNEIRPEGQKVFDFVDLIGCVDTNRSVYEEGNNQIKTQLDLYLLKDFFGKKTINGKPRDEEAFNKLLNNLREYRKLQEVDTTDIEYCITSLKDDYDIRIDELYKAMRIHVGISHLKQYDKLFDAEVMPAKELLEVMSHINTVEKRLRERYTVGIQLLDDESITILIKEK